MTGQIPPLPTWDEQTRRILKLRNLLEQCRLVNAQLRAENQALKTRLERIRAKRREAAE